MNRLFDFAPFQLDEPERRLTTAGHTLHLSAKAFDVLLVLLERRGRLVSKAELLRAVWGEVHVDEAVLTRAIADIRKALGQSDGGVWIETVPKFGYRFVGEVTVSEAGEAPPEVKSKPTRHWPVMQRWPRRWIWAAITAFALLTLALAVRRVPPRTEIRRLAVLPFQVITSPDGDGALGMSLADAVITRLSNFEDLIVRPLAAVRRFEDVSADSRRLAKELGVDAVLEGTLQISDRSARASLRLIRASDEKVLWVEVLETSSSRLFELEDLLADRAAANMAVRLGTKEAHVLARHKDVNSEAHRLYVNGRYEWGRRTRAGLEKSAELFRQSLDVDPGYAQAYAGLADSYLLLGLYGYEATLEALPKARATALRALELDPDLAESHATLGLIAQNLDWDWAAAERHYREAIRLSPNHPTAHHWYAEFLSILGRFDESEREFARARQIDPLSPIIRVDEAQLYFFERRYDRALQLLREAARDDPSFALAHERLAFTHLAQGHEEDAWREAMALDECAAETSPCRMRWSALLPRRNPEAAKIALERLDAGARADGTPDADLLFALIRQGHTVRALDVLELMVKTHSVWLITAKVNPLFDPLREQARWKVVLSRLHLN
jgi:DNA-binding winged helix-turn-helix (wHTH) protein/TolB-like protein